MKRQPHGGGSGRGVSSADAVETLFSQFSGGDADAREKLIVRFLPFAHKLARGYQGRGEPVEDLCQTASVGLIMSAVKMST